MRRSVRQAQRQAGFTLVEVLLAIAVLGIGVLATVSGMMTSIKVSTQGQAAAESLTALRGYAEAVAEAPYVECGALSPSAYTPAFTSFSVPAGLTATSTLQRWSGGSAATGTFVSTVACTSPDAGIQKITLTVTGTDGVVQSLGLVKRRAT